MKYFILMLAFIASAVFAEPTFDQMQDLIAQKQYAAAEQGLELIIKNHPNSAKAFYSMAQTQAGLGRLDKAQFALNKARGIDPTLKFAEQSNIEALQVAIMPQTTKIQKVESGINWLVVFLTVLGFFIIGYLAYMFFKKDKPAAEPFTGHVPPQPMPEPPTSPSDSSYTRTYKSTTQSTPRYTSSYSPSYSSPVPQTVVVNNGNDGFVTGMLMGEMMSNHNHHETTRVVEREVIREVPARETYTPTAQSSSWGGGSSSSSSWDDDSRKSSSSSSWGSSSDSSSSWDSGSSSSDSSSSSSSWD